MRQLLASRLAPLASLEAQRRYIVHGTRQEYMVPLELIEDASDVIRMVREITVVRNSLLATEIQGILDLAALLDAAADSCQSAQTNESLIELDPAWRAAREQARRCLDILDFNLAEWEQSCGTKG